MLSINYQTVNSEAGCENIKSHEFETGAA